jgi:hypothetical protein
VSHTGPLGEAHLVLYLLPVGLYLFVGSWIGFELTVAVGHWSEAGGRIRLTGVGRQLMTDVSPSIGHRPHQRELRIVFSGQAPVLVADTEDEGWSLLSWKGPLYFLGQRHWFPVPSDLLPHSYREIEPWIRQFAGV